MIHVNVVLVFLEYLELVHMRHARLALKRVSCLSTSGCLCRLYTSHTIEKRSNSSPRWVGSVLKPNSWAQSVERWSVHLRPSKSAEGVSHKRGGRPLIQHLTTSASLQEDGDIQEDPFFSTRVFREVVQDSEFADMLEEAGFSRMSLAQQASYDIVRNGNSVVLAAETGSGKTLAYLAPLMEKMVSVRKGEEKDGSLLILCPNSMLCEQVVNVIHTLCTCEKAPDEYKNMKAAYVSSQQMTFEDSNDGFPDIVVTTPGALYSILTGVGPVIGHQWTFEGLRKWARYVVLDEADMLLGGAFGKQINHLLDELRGGDRERAALRSCEEIGIRLDEYWDLPRHIRKAAQLHGGQGMIDAGVSEYLNHNCDAMHSDVWLRQYAFVGATMPTNGKETVGAKIAAEYPTAVWVNGEQLHKTMRQVEFRWMDIKKSRYDSLLEVIQGDPSISDGSGRMIVFTKDSKSSGDVSDMLSRSLQIDSGPLVLSYHKNMGQQDREEALRVLRSNLPVDNDGRTSIILVCTDANARGLDVPGVSHVVHADFPASAVDFLHRSGRTGRAGRSGIVTSLVDDNSRDLADAIKDLMSENVPIEGAFSRNRSFRKKFKKYGKFVKRGEVPL